MTATAHVDLVSNDAGEFVRREHARDLGAGVVVGIHRLAKLAQLHDLSNQAFLRQLQQSHQTISDYCLRSGGHVNVLFAHRAVFVAGQLLKGSRGIYESAGELGELLQWCGGQELTITRDVTLEDLRGFAEAISGALHTERGSFKSPCPHIRLKLVAEAARLRGLDLEKLSVEQRIVRSYANAVVILRRFYEDLAAGRMLLPQRVKRVAQNLVDLSDGSTAAFLGVTQMRNANTDEAGRAVNTAILSVLMARELTQDRATLSQIAVSAMMHDAGRPRAIANAQRAGAIGMVRARLSEEEEDRLPAGTAAVMTALGRLNEASIRRTVITFEALSLRRASSIGPLYGGARPATLHARILMIARRYNDLMTPDPGLAAPAPDHAIARLSVELVDPADKTLLRALVHALGLYPIGTVLQLESGEVVESVSSNGGGLPVVRVAMDARGVAATQKVEIDLAQRSDVRIARVLSVDGWRKGEGATDSGDGVPDASNPSASRVQSRGSSPPAVAAEPSYGAPPSSQVTPQPSSPSRQSFVSKPSASFASVLTPGTSPSQVVDAVIQRATQSPNPRIAQPRAPAPPPTIVETDDGRTVLTASPYDEAQAAAAAEEGGRPAATAVGNIQATPVVHILVYVLEHRLAGSVEFRDPAGQCHFIHFSKGTPIKVKTGNRVAPLAKELVAAGAVSEPVAASAVIEAKAAGLRLGEYLVGQGSLRASDLELALTRHMRKKLAAVVNLAPQTTYAFYKDLCLVDDESEIDIEPIGTILSVVRAWHDRARIRATLQRIAGQLMQIHPESTIDGAEMTEQEALVLQVMRENQITLAELFRVKGLDEEAVATLTYTLAVTRHVLLPGQRGGPMAIGTATPSPSAPLRTIHTAAPASPRVAPSAGGAAGARPAPPQSPVVHDDPAPPMSERAPKSQRQPRPSVEPAPPVSVRMPQPEPQPSVDEAPASSVPRSAPISAGSPEAVRELRGAEQALQRKDVPAAERLVQRAMQLDPDDPVIAAFHAWVLVMAGKQSAVEGVAMLTKLLSRHPQCTRAYLFRAKLLKRENKLREAATDFDQVLKNDPDNKEAKGELKLLTLFVRR